MILNVSIVLGGVLVAAIIAVAINAYFSLKRAMTQYQALESRLGALFVKVEGIDVDFLKRLLSKQAELEIELQKRDTQIELLDEKITSYQNREAGRNRWKKKQEEKPQEPAQPEPVAYPNYPQTNGVPQQAEEPEPQWVRQSRVR